MKISVITPTIRKNGLEIINKALSKQTFTDFEWLIGARFDPGYTTATHIVDDFVGGYWSLNRIYNRLFSNAKGELIVSLQDFIWIPPDGLEKFWVNYEKTGKNSIISGVGDQYESLNKWGKPHIKIWSDPRKTTQNGSFYECYPNDAEWNWCAIPATAIRRVGGMDEGLDFLGYGGDQLQACQRMDAAGIKFYLDQTNESYTLRHSREDFGGQSEWDRHHVLFNGAYDKRIRELKMQRLWPDVHCLSTENTCIKKK